MKIKEEFVEWSLLFIESWDKNYLLISVSFSFVNLKVLKLDLWKNVPLMKSEACYLRLERLVIFLSFKVVPAGST